MKAKNKPLIYRMAFALILIIAGAIFQMNGIGKDFLSAWTLGAWLIYVGVLIIFIALLRSTVIPKKKVDERVQYIGMKASKVTFMALILISFAVMIIDGIKHLNIPYRLFMGYLISAIVLIYFIAYKVLEKRN